jgi:putative flippase GtrA
MGKSYHEEVCEVCVWSHVFFTLPMTAVMGAGGWFHGDKDQLMTGFTLPYAGKPINWRHDFNHTCGSLTTNTTRVLSVVKEQGDIMAAFSGTSSGKEVERFGRFLAVGSVGTLLDFSLLTLLKLAGLPTLMANSLSFLVGLVNNFTWNRLWTFGDSAQPGWRRQLTQFAAVSLVGLALNNAIVLILEEPLGNMLGHPAWGYLPAKVVATSLVVFWNYFANRMWTFGKGPARRKNN